MTRISALDFTCTAHGGHDVLDAVAGNAKVVDLGALIVCQGAERKAVGINNLARSGRAAGRNKLVAGAKDGDFGPPVHAET